MPLHIFQKRKELIIYIPQENIRSSVVYSYINRFRIWYDTNDVRPILLEKSISSDEFGGTIDFYGEINGEYTLLDFKTSKKIRLTMFIQLALYVILLEELGYKIDRVGILLVNPKFKDEKYITREKFEKYVKFARGLVNLFWSYFEINEDDEKSIRPRCGHCAVDSMHSDFDRHARSPAKAAVSAPLR